MEKVRRSTLLLVAGSLVLFAAGIFSGLRMAGTPRPTPLPPEQRTAAVPTPGPAATIAPLPGDSPFADLAPGPGPVGDGIIFGKVTTEDGRPLAGVTVRAQPNVPHFPDRLGGPPPPGDPRMPQIRAEVRHMLLARAGIREALSDQDGRFLITGIADMSYWIEGFKPGYLIRREERGNVHAGQDIPLIAHPMVRLEARVLGPDGQPARYALLEIKRGAGGSGHRAWTPEHPAVEFAPGPLWIRAVTNDGFRFASESEERLLVVGVRAKPVVLRLRERTGICGTLRFPPIDVSGDVNARIVALRVRDDVPPDPSRLLREYHVEGRLHTYSPRGGTGDFIMADLPPATYLVGALRQYREVLDSTVVTVSEGMAEVELAVPTPGVGEAITLRVLGPDGQPIESNVNVQARHIAADGATASGGQPDRLGRGSWRVRTPPVPPGQDAGGRFVLAIRSGEFGELVVPYDPDGTGEFEARFPEPASLTVLLPNYQGSCYEGSAQIVAAPDRPRGERSGFPEKKRPGPRGETTFGPLVPGDWIVSVLVDSGKYGTDTVLEIPVRLASGAQEITLNPPPLYDLTVEVPEGDAVYRLEPMGAASFRSSPMRNGDTIRFSRLEPGAYVLRRYAGPTTAGMTLELRGDLALTFLPEVLAALRVSVVNSEGALPAAGLRDGDLLVAIAGTEIENAGQAWTLVRDRMAAGPQQLTVRRGTNQFTVSVDLEQIFNPQIMGGRLQSWKR
jgi:hypothetical protein